MTNQIQPPHLPASGAKKHRLLLPLWRVQGTVTLKTPLSIGSGRDQSIDTLDKGEIDPHVVVVVRDHRNRPYIPASSLKGALNALARECDMPEDLRSLLFGSEDMAQKTTSAARVEFCDLRPRSLTNNSGLPNWGIPDHEHVANVPHVAIDRITRTAEDRKLFLEQVVPPKSDFLFECTARDLDQSAIESLLGLLQLAGCVDSPIRLGGGKAADNGRFAWQAGEVRCLDDLTNLWTTLSSPEPPPTVDIWSSPYSCEMAVQPASHRIADRPWLVLSNLSLTFHTPFLVYQRQPEPDAGQVPDGRPRTTHCNDPVLPSSSLHGALRAQAERILRTVGLECVGISQKVPAVGNAGDAGRTLDLAAVLFGAPGWRSLVRLTDFTAAQNASTLKHEMLAIDRLTGGGKDGYKFTIEALDCPTLTGTLSLDLSRLDRVERANPGTTATLLGLLAHVLRDLDEGDIALGYGAAKGYGRSRGRSCQALDDALKQARPAGIGGIKDALAAFAGRLAPHAPFSPPHGGDEPTPAEPSPKQEKPSHNDGYLFHNPYAFIPFGTARRDDSGMPWTSHDAIAGGQTHHGHASYQDGAYNGRVVCRLTTKTPIFVGAGDAQIDGFPTQKEHFRLNGKIALPATSLRGMISSLHESITGSRLRVMDDRRYSIRAPIRNALSAVGRVLEIGGTYWLQMLALPTLPLDGNGEAPIPEGYRALLPSNLRSAPAPLKSLLGDEDSPLPGHFSTYTVSSPSRWYLEDRARARIRIRSDELTLEVAPGQESRFHIKTQRASRYLLGERRVRDEFPIDKPKMTEQRRGNPNSEYHRGVLRIMAAEGRDLVAQRKHELFVPLSAQQEKVVKFVLERAGREKRAEVTQSDLDSIDLAANYDLLPIPPSTIARFNRLADEMTRSQDNEETIDQHQIRPYHPTGTSRQKAPPESIHHGLKKAHRNRALRLKHGDLVYFRPNADSTAIEEIAYSSIWRDEISQNVSTWIGDDLAPITFDKGENALLSPSELLFGYIEAKPAGHAGGREGHAARAFASKVSFGHGRSLAPPEQLEPVTLKILSSPKPPSPSMYFENARATTQVLSKGALADDPDAFRPKGRKTYLHGLCVNDNQVHGVTPLDRKGNNSGSVNGLPPWQSHPPAENAPKTEWDAYARANMQRARVAPIRNGEAFFFEVDFVNLSQAELQSLCASLSPHESYHHKLGMGKPIGLGSVKLDMVGLYLVDRSARYRQGDFTCAARYASIWKCASLQSLPPHLECEQQANHTPNGIDPGQLANMQMAALSETDRAVYNAICLTGSRSAVSKPVHYPQLRNKNIEQESFAWFVQNEKPDGEQQRLDSFTNASDALPFLKR